MSLQQKTFHFALKCDFGGTIRKEKRKYGEYQYMYSEL